jgi:hypothetical protein
MEPLEAKVTTAPYLLQRVLCVQQAGAVPYNLQRLLCVSSSHYYCIVCKRASPCIHDCYQRNGLHTAPRLLHCVRSAAVGILL